ncbi:MAG: hypothetical protein AAGA75_26610 [Cyanobacteria bacterium P01_E01_bin.6]
MSITLKLLPGEVCSSLTSSSQSPTPARTTIYNMKAIAYQWQAALVGTNLPSEDLQVGLTPIAWVPDIATFS